MSSKQIMSPPARTPSTGVYIDAGVKPIRPKTPVNEKSKENTNAFGTQSERFTTSDYFIGQMGLHQSAGQTGMFGSGPNYHAVPERSSERAGSLGGTPNAELTHSWHERPSTPNGSSHGRSPTPNGPPKSDPSRLWMGSRGPISNQGEMRLQEVLNLSKRSTEKGPGPGAYDMFKEKMPYSKKSFHRGHMTPSGVTVPRDFMPGHMPDEVPGPGAYKETKAIQKMRGKSSMPYHGSSSHLACGRNGHSPVPKIRAPSISFAMKVGHDWRLVVDLQRPKSEPLTYMPPPSVHGRSRSPHAAGRAPSANSSSSKDLLSRRGSPVKDTRSMSKINAKVNRLDDRDVSFAEQLLESSEVSTYSVPNSYPNDQIHFTEPQHFQYSHNRNTPSVQLSSRSSELNTYSETSARAARAAAEVVEVEKRQVDWRRRNLVGPSMPNSSSPSPLWPFNPDQAASAAPPPPHGY
ncbi:hypothetical protein CYMTET_19972 [Cymbomonas tetramitiformis]|uniref:Uncharacterized protein n=1 Tax=Cymbomonas tetramitiformis TaxID=36881 RepID=A0AAE0G503_9CHLO|nr:hypothetical protein CYMTET_19972 [Cymbomonas tetramitiformis]